MQDACHMNFVIDLAHHSLCGSLVEHRSAESEGLMFDSSWRIWSFSSSLARDKTKNMFSNKKFNFSNNMLHTIICICQKPPSLPHHSEGRRGSIFENIRISFRVGLGLHWRSTAVCRKVVGICTKVHTTTRKGIVSSFQIAVSALASGFQGKGWENIPVRKRQSEFQEFTLFGKLNLFWKCFENWWLESNDWWFEHEYKEYQKSRRASIV